MTATILRERRRSARIPEAAFASVIHAYYGSHKFTQPPPIGLAESTKEGYRQYLRLAELPDALGGISVNTIGPWDVQEFLDELNDRPGAQERAKVALGAVESYAMPRRMLLYPITTGVEIIGSSGGHKPWSNNHVELAEQKARGPISRIVTLAANTGQRGSDLIRMCPTDLEEFQGRLGINVRQRKTGLQIWIPLTRPLEAAMATWKRLPGPFLRKADGSAWASRHDMSEAWNWERDHNPALEPLRATPEGAPEPRRGLVVHGLRATACVRLWEAGCPTTLISKMVGLSLNMVERYVRFAAQKVSAMAAVRFLDGTAAERLTAADVRNQMLSG